MKSIGDQAKSFREWKQWDAKRMAEEVKRHFEGKMSRQKIQQLEQAGSRRPQYLAALAKTMGTTVEVLEAGRWVKPGELPVSNDDGCDSTTTLEQHLRALAAAAMRVKDQARRDSAANLIHLVVQNPEENADDQIPIIVKKLSGEPFEDSAPSNRASAA